MRLHLLEKNNPLLIFTFLKTFLQRILFFIIIINALSVTLIAFHKTDC